MPSPQAEQLMDLCGLALNNSDYFEMTGGLAGGGDAHPMIESMPGVAQMSVDRLVVECQRIESLGIPAVMLPLTVGGSDQSSDLFKWFDDILDRLLTAGNTQ